MKLWTRSTFRVHRRQWPSPACHNTFPITLRTERLFAHLPLFLITKMRQAAALVVWHGRGPALLLGDWGNHMENNSQEGKQGNVACSSWWKFCELPLPVCFSWATEGSAGWGWVAYPCLALLLSTRVKRSPCHCSPPTQGWDVLQLAARASMRAGFVPTCPKHFLCGVAISRAMGSGPCFQPCEVDLLA